MQWDSLCNTPTSHPQTPSSLTSSTARHPCDIGPLLEELFLYSKEPVMNVNVPDDFDQIQFDAQITAWIREKPGYDELMKRIRERWPTVPAELVNLTVSMMQRRVALEMPPPIQLDRELYRIHYKRVKRLKQLEKVLDAGEAPVSMHTLYRGLLRDHESICLKMKASRRQDRLDQLKQEQSAPKNIQPGDPTGWNEYLRQFTKLKVEKDDEEEEDEPTPTQRPSPGSFRSMCWLIGFIVAGCLLGAWQGAQGIPRVPCHGSHVVDEADQLLEHRPQVQHPILLSRGGFLAGADCQVQSQRAGLEDHALQRHLFLMHFVQIGLHLADTDGVSACTAFVQPSHAVDGREDVLGHGQLQFIADEVIGATAGAMIAGPLDDLGGRVLQHRSAILVAHHQVLAGGSLDAGEHLVRFFHRAALFENAAIVEQERNTFGIERRAGFLGRAGGFERSDGETRIVDAADDADGAGEADGSERLLAGLLVDGDEGVLLQVAKPHVIHVAGEDGLPGAAAILVDDDC